MPALVHVLGGPEGSGKTSRLLDRYGSLCRSAFGTALWIGPTQRNVAAVRQELLDRMPGAIGLHLCAFQGFAEELIRVNDPAARPLSEVQKRLLADELVADLHARKDLSHFERVIDTRGFGDGVFAFLAELKRNEIWPRDFARAAYRRARGQTINAKDRQCARLYARYQQHLRRLWRFDLEGRYWYARDLLARGLRRPFEGIQAVFVDGFTHFTRTQQEIIEALAGWAAELWVTLPDEPGTDRAELFTRPRATLGKLQRLSLSQPLSVLACPPLTPDPSPPRGEGNLVAALAHLERQLFRPLRSIVKSGEANGIRCIQAPGLLGETRMVARAIKSLLLEGVAADDIVVSMRDLAPYADLVREVFGDYGIPLDVEGSEPLLRNPAVATLLRAVRLPEDDWPFAGLTALLRSTYFRPDWPEAGPDIPQRAEVLLRTLGEPRGRDAYLAAVDRWADNPPPPFEDDEDESHRQRVQELAQRCRPFLRRLFQCWDSAPASGPLTEHATWLQSFSTDLGLCRSADDPRDQAALRQLTEELAQWQRIANELNGGRACDRRQFAHMLQVLASTAGLPRTTRGPGRVRVLSAELASGLKTPHLFLMGLGERSFPSLAAPEPFFDEGERQSFHHAGLDLPVLGDRLADEMLLFYQLVTRARRQLILSYPAVDDQGQALLPSPFLTAVLDCFTPEAVPVQAQRMLLEGLGQETPLSPAEYRVQAARVMAVRGKEPAFPPEQEVLAGNLRMARQIIQRRTRAPDFSSYDGLLRHPAVLAELERRCGTHKVFSPTALETYIACPFRFMLHNVLHLEPLEEPTEEIEQTRRGLAFHRALSRLHQELSSAGIHTPSPEVEARLQARLDEVVEEHIGRAGSPASQELWRIEGRRLRRAGSRYREQWQKFLSPWQERRIAPRPLAFEQAFGRPEPLVIDIDGIEVRLGGRIDRVDLAELTDGLGFWVIDYKTGNAQHYTKQLAEFERLQLTVYALAVERGLLAGQNARPLGLAYWLVDADGPKPALPSKTKQTSWLNDPEHWPRVRRQLERWVVTLAGKIRQGDFPLKPRSPDCTDRCPYAQVCRITQSRAAVGKKSWQLPLPTVDDPPESAEDEE